MRVTKRNGTLEEVSFDKVIRRLTRLAKMDPVCDNVDPTLVATGAPAHQSLVPGS